MDRGLIEIVGLAHQGVHNNLEAIPGPKSQTGMV
jgi:hypothetical protein